MIATFKLSLFLNQIKINMKKLLFTLSAGSLLFFASCSDKKEGSGGMSEKAKKNMAANDAIMKMFETGDWSKVGDYIATDAVDHSGPKGDIVGLDSLKAYFNQMGQMMTNMKNDIIKTLADDEYVMCYVKGSGTAKVDLPDWGMKAGQSHTGTSVEVSKFKDGKVTDHWTFMDANEMMQMMSGGQPPATDSKTVPAKDTTSK
jgi:predicted SnoaL-like aldol condensation-catalyzing enzyme